MTAPAHVDKLLTDSTEDRKVSVDPDAAFAVARIAVLIPCYNEAATIGTVVTDFAPALPTADIYVYDNNSTDDTREHRRAGRRHRALREPLQGKGNVVRRMFADIEADVYVLVDGDGTYDAGSAARMVEAAVDELARHGQRRPRGDVTDRAYRPGHGSAIAC